MRKSGEIIIKKYLNRKFYNTRDSYYISLDDIYNIASCGIPVKIIQNSTQEDITAITLFDAWASNQRTHDLDLEYVINLIKGGNNE